MAFLAVLQPDARVAARLTAALSSGHRVQCVATWRGLEQLLLAGGVDGCVVDMAHPDRDVAVGEVRRLRRRYPAVAIVVQMDLGGAEGEPFRLGTLGVEALLPEESSYAGMQETVDRALDLARAAQVGRALEGRLDPDDIRMVTWVMEQGRDLPSVDDFADAMGRSVPALRASLRSAGLPPPGRLLVWGRLLLAAGYLTRDGRTVEEAAYMLGYSTANALARAIKRETGLTATEVVERGGLAAVVGLLFGGRRGTVIGRNRWLSAVAGALLLGSGACAGGPGARIDTVLDTPPVDQVSFGVLAVDATTGAVLYARNAHRKFIPASNQKVLVTAAALSLLGPDHRWETALWSRAPLSDGTLDGDLVLVGTGDPTLSGRYWPSDRAPLDALADSLHAAGVRRVEGRLLVDVTAWDSTTIGNSWEVADLPWRYAATGGAFAVNEGELTLVVRGAMDPGRPAAVHWTPLGDDTFVDNRLVTVAPDSTVRVRPYYQPERRRIVVEGHVPAGRADTVSVALRDPVRQATAALHRALRRRGIRVDGGTDVVWSAEAAPWRECSAEGITRCAGARRVAALLSPPLIRVVEGILEPSQNWMTEQLVRTLGALHGGEGSWDAGLDVVVGYMVDHMGVDSMDVAPRDGSGLSAYNLVTPRALVAVLRYMREGPYARGFRDAMAEPGEDGSTLSRRLEGLEGVVYAKTGTISNVNSLSGYLVGEEGGEVIFAILSNGSGLPASTVRATLDDVLRILAGRQP